MPDTLSPDAEARRGSSSTLRVVFAGTPEFAATALNALINSRYCNVVAVYSQPDRPKGRGKKLSPSAVKALALDYGLPVLQPQNFKHSDTVAELARLDADIMVVAAYGLLLPEAVLSTPRFGCINIHASLLPRWRGAAPIERAIEHGDTETGVTIMQMEKGLDTGPMVLKRSIELQGSDTGDSVREALAILGGQCIVEALQQYAPEDSKSHGDAEARLKAEVQDEALANYAAKIHKVECLIDWSQSADTVARKIRAFYSGYTTHGFLNGERIKFGGAQSVLENDIIERCAAGTITSADKTGLRVACGSGVVELTRLQLAGAKMMASADVLNSRADKFKVGSVFSDLETH
ncbi:MAG: methionyl-tRNA formyltransferase [Pseudomonadales bacterium]